MTREEVYRDIEEHCGFVPDFMKLVPESTLEHDWGIMKALDFEEGKLGLRIKSLIGLSVSAATKCRDCVLYYTEMAKFHGVTDEEIREALRCGMDAAGWSLFAEGVQYDYEKLKDELRRISEYVSSRKERVERAAI